MHKSTFQVVPILILREYLLNFVNLLTMLCCIVVCIVLSLQGQVGGDGLIHYKKSTKNMFLRLVQKKSDAKWTRCKMSHVKEGVCLIVVAGDVLQLLHHLVHHHQAQQGGQIAKMVSRHIKNSCIKFCYESQRKI